MKPSGPGVFFVGRFLVTDSDFPLLFVPILECCIFLEIYPFHENFILNWHNCSHIDLYLDSYSCCNNLSQTWGLKPTQIYSCTVWRPEDKNGLHWAEVKVSAGHAPAMPCNQQTLYRCVFHIIHDHVSHLSQ